MKTLIRMVIESDVQSTVHLNVLVVLAATATKDGESCPSVDRLAKDSRPGRSTVLRALGELEAEGFLTRHRRRAAPSIYWLSRERLSRPRSTGERVSTDLVQKRRGPSRFSFFGQLSRGATTSRMTSMPPRTGSELRRPYLRKDRPRTRRTPQDQRDGWGTRT